MTRKKESKYTVTNSKTELKVLDKSKPVAKRKKLKTAESLHGSTIKSIPKKKLKTAESLRGSTIKSIPKKKFCADSKKSTIIDNTSSNKYIFNINHVFRTTMLKQEDSDCSFMITLPNGVITASSEFLKLYNMNPVVKLTVMQENDKNHQQIQCLDTEIDSEALTCGNSMNFSLESDLESEFHKESLYNMSASYITRKLDGAEYKLEAEEVSQSDIDVMPYTNDVDDYSGIASKNNFIVSSDETEKVKEELANYNLTLDQVLSSFTPLNTKHILELMAQDKNLKIGYLKGVKCKHGITNKDCIVITNTDGGRYEVIAELI